MSEEFLQRTYQARDAYLRELGAVDDFVLAPLMNPAFMGGPAWPSLRQAWRVVRNGPRTIIVSDGLSDPFEDQPEPNAGFGLEFLGETADALPAQLGTSWLFDIVYGVSQQAAAHGGFREFIDELGLLSTEVGAPGELKALAGPKGSVGVLLGLRPSVGRAEWDLPGGLVKVVTVKLLQPPELAYIIENGEAGRERLRELFAADGSHHLSSPSRPSVI